MAPNSRESPRVKFVGADRRECAQNIGAEEVAARYRRLAPTLDATAVALMPDARFPTGLRAQPSQSLLCRRRTRGRASSLARPPTWCQARCLHRANLALRRRPIHKPDTYSASQTHLRKNRCREHPGQHNQTGHWGGQLRPRRIRLPSRVFNARSHRSCQRQPRHRTIAHTYPRGDHLRQVVAGSLAYHCGRSAPAADRLQQEERRCPNPTSFSKRRSCTSRAE